MTILAALRRLRVDHSEDINGPVLKGGIYCMDSCAIATRIPSADAPRAVPSG
jgi:hypothetical protein